MQKQKNYKKIENYHNRNPTGQKIFNFQSIFVLQNFKCHDNCNLIMHVLICNELIIKLYYCNVV